VVARCERPAASVIATVTSAAVAPVLSETIPRSVPVDWACARLARPSSTTRAATIAM
jgi:hypothetical protein